MDDDFNTGGAIGELFEMVHALNRFANHRPADREPGQPTARRVPRGMVVLKELSADPRPLPPGAARPAAAAERAA